MFFNKKEEMNKRRKYFWNTKTLSHINKRKSSSFDNSIQNIKQQIDFLINSDESLKQRIGELEQELKYINSWQTDFYKDIPEKFPIVLTEKERNLLIQHVKKSKNYLEFGSGGSSFLVLINSQTNVYSVESDYNWVNYIRSWNFIKSKEKEEKIVFEIVDIGKTGKWGFPLDSSVKELYPNYSGKTFNKLKNQEIDTVFIDGRFRVACALAAALHYPHAAIIIHDYTVRPYYHIAENYLDIIETADSMVVMKRKKNCDLDSLQKTYDEYKYIAM